MRRRTFLLAPFTIGTGALLGHLAACGAAPASAPPPSTSGGAELIATPEPTMAATIRTLVAYFSRAGENYYYVDRTTLDVGNSYVANWPDSSPPGAARTGLSTQSTATRS